MITLIVGQQLNLLSLLMFIQLIFTINSLQLMVKEVTTTTTTDDHHHKQHFNQTRLKRSITDRWPSNIETWQTSLSSTSPTTNKHPQHQHQQLKSSSTLNIKSALTPTAQRYTVPPIFEDYIESNGDTSSSSLTTSHADCSMTLVSSTPTPTPTSSSSSSSSSSIASKVNIYNMRINDFTKCGVKSERSADGKEWMSVTLRVPFISGLRTAQDEHVVIVCRPQEPVMAKSSLLDFRTNVQRPVKTVYSSLEPEVDVKVGLFAKPAGATYYSEEIPIDGAIEVGEELQFRAIVKPGDGWKYAKLTDLKVYMIQGGSELDENFDDQHLTLTTASKLMKKKGKDESLSQSVVGVSGNNKSPNELRKDSNSKDNGAGGGGVTGKVGGVATLVLDNGCRNPVYSALAPYHPYRDTSNPLAVAFNFKAFMFQEMPDDGSIRITAKIMACLEEADCSPSLCLDNGQQGYGKRRRKRNISIDEDKQHLNKSIKRSNKLNSSNQTLEGNYFKGKRYSKDFQVRVSLPKGFTKSRIANIKLTARKAERAIVINHEEKI